MERKPMSPRRKAGERWFVVIMLTTLIAALGGAPVLFLALLGAVRVAVSRSHTVIWRHLAYHQE